MSETQVLSHQDVFILDGRDIEAWLEGFEQYCSRIPYGDQGETWADVFFRSAQTSVSDKRLTVQELIALYKAADGAALIDGTLSPHQSYLLAFLKAQQTSRGLFNTLPMAHRILYYQGLLGLFPDTAQPDQVAVSCVLASDTDTLYLPEGTYLDGGSDENGASIQFRLDSGVLANQGKWSDLYWCLGDSEKSICKAFDSASSWPESGMRLFDAEKSEPMTQGRIVSSPLLQMSAGERYITVTFAAAITAPIVELSAYASHAAVDGESGWFELTLLSDLSTASDSVEFLARSDQAAIAGNNEFTMPSLKLVNHTSEKLPEILNIAARVENMPNLYLSTDEELGDVNEQIEPFGDEPIVGCCFNLISEDWLNKAGFNIKLTPAWLDLPPENQSGRFQTWYQGYDTTEVGGGPDLTGLDEKFQLWAKIHHPGELSKESDKVTLFNSEGEPNTLSFSVSEMKGVASDSSEPTDWPYWLSFELYQQDFLHARYWQIMSAGADIAVNPPYTPNWQSIKVDVDYGSAPPQQQYVLTPFGYSIENEVLPSGINQLYLGFEQLLPGQVLTLYWQLRATVPFEISWCYLNNQSQWMPLDAEINDETLGLSQPGRWQVILPNDIGLKTTRFLEAQPSEEQSQEAESDELSEAKVWLRASLAEQQKPYDYPWLFGLITNAACATRVLSDNTQTELVLPRETINQTVEFIEGIDVINQPWASFGGQASETVEAYISRLEKRLASRNRVMTWQDVRDYLLTHYPEIYDVVLPHENSLDAPFCYSTPLANVFAIPAFGQQDNLDQLRPVFSDTRLMKMKQSVIDYSSPWLNFALCNPIYRDIVITCDVQFITGINDAYGQEQLWLDLEQEYMPWSHNNAHVTVPTGYSLDYYTVVNFISCRDYVQQVNSLLMNGQKQSVVMNEGEVGILVAKAGSTESEQINTHGDVIKQ